MENKQKNQNILVGASYGGVAFCVAMILYVVLSLLGQSIVTAFCDSKSIWYYAINSTYSAIALLIVAIFCNKYLKKSYKSGLFLNNCKVKFYASSILLFAGLFFGLGFINQAFNSLIKLIGINVAKIEQGQEILLSLCKGSLLNYLVLVLVLAVLPAVCEELFFRGLLFSFLGGGKVFAVLISSISFALYHCSLSQLVYQFFCGIAFCLLASKSKSIFPCMIAHFLNNFAILTFTYFGVNIDFYSILVIAGGLVSLGLFFLLTFYKSKATKTENSTSEKVEVKEQNLSEKMEKYFIPYGLFAFLICIALLVGNLV